MKTKRFVQAAVLLLVTVGLVSCSSGRQYRSYPPPPPGPPRTSVSLVIHSGPGMVVNRYRDGRYYYRSPQGMMYWRGNDNRYYLDRRYVNRSYHQHRQYNDWRRYNRGRRR